METTVRLLAKSITWQVMGFCSMTLIGYLYTGSISVGGGIAVSAALTGFIGYFVHETLWSKVGWGRSYTKGR